MISSREIAQSIVVLQERGYKTSEITDAVVSFLSHNHLTSLLSQVNNELERIKKEKENEEQLTVTTARSLPKKTIQSIVDAIDADKNKVSVEENDTLIGGFIAEYRHTIYDASVQTQLEQLQATLTK